MADLTGQLRRAVLEAGFETCGVTSADPVEAASDVYAHVQPRELLPGATAVVVAGFSVAYEPRVEPSAPGVPRGRFTPYGSRAFQQMVDHGERTIAAFLEARGYCAAPAPRMPIKPAAVRAGLGCYGKHGVVATPELGSWCMFAAVVTDAPLEIVERPLFESDCPEGCTLCLEACPTGAIVDEHRVDAALCITHWLWGNYAPPRLRPQQGTRLFGCAECLLACPHNIDVEPRRSYPVPIDELGDSPELIPMATMDEGHFLRTVPTFARRAGIEAMRGNAIIALGNVGDPTAVPTLGRTLRYEDPQVRAYSAWALGRIGGRGTRDLLAAARASESDPAVLTEVEAALERV